MLITSWSSHASHSLIFSTSSHSWTPLTITNSKGNIPTFKTRKQSILCLSFSITSLFVCVGCKVCNMTESRYNFSAKFHPRSSQGPRVLQPKPKEVNEPAMTSYPVAPGTARTNRIRSPSSRSHTSSSQCLQMEDYNEETDRVESPNTIEYRKRSIQYLQQHTSRYSQKAVAELKSLSEQYKEEIDERVVSLQENIHKKKSNVMNSIDIALFTPPANLSGNSNCVNEMNMTQRMLSNPVVKTFTESSLFKMLDKRNVDKKKGKGGPGIKLDYKEFMFFDRNTAKRLEFAIKTFGDPSFNVHYSRDYSTVAQYPVVFGSSGRNLDQFHGPTSVTTDERSNIFVCDSMNSRILAFTDKRKPMFELGGKGRGDGELDRCVSVCSDKVGNLFVADTFNDRIAVFSGDSGAWKFNFGSSGKSNGKFNRPRGVSVSNDGDTVVVSDTGNQKIQVFSGGGVHRGSWGKLGMKQGQFVRPQGLHYCDWNKKVYVTDQWNYRVEIFDLEGRVLGSIGSKGDALGQFAEPRDVAVDGRGNILVTDTVKCSLQVFDKNGQFIKSYGGPGAGDHEFDYPEGVHIDDFYQVYIADRRNNRVHII